MPILGGYIIPNIGDAREVNMAQTTILFVPLLLVGLALSACDAENSETPNRSSPISDSTSSDTANTLSQIPPDKTDNINPVIVALDGLWVSNCSTRYPQDQAGFEREHLVVEGSLYERTISYYEDADCSVPQDISFLRVRSVGLQYPGGLVETERGSASQIVVTAPTIDFDRRLLTDEEAALFDPALYFYDFYLFSADGRLHFGSMNTLPANQFEQTLDSPHIFSAQ